MNFVCIVFELGDKMLTLSSMENLIVHCNRKRATTDKHGKRADTETIPGKRDIHGKRTITCTIRRE